MPYHALPNTPPKKSTITELKMGCLKIRDSNNYSKHFLEHVGSQKFQPLACHFPIVEHTCIVWVSWRLQPPNPRNFMMWGGDGKHCCTTRHVHANFPKPVGWHGHGIPSHSQHIRFSTPFARPTAQHACHFGLRWNHIGKCSEWICFADCTKQACIRQNHSKILGVCVQFTSHAAANVHCSVRFFCFQS